MGWRRLGLVFAGARQYPWMASHASVPIAEPIDGNIVRIYFAPRDDRNRSHVAWLVIDLSRPRDILDLSATPVLSPGRAGSFDESGTIASCVVADGGVRYLYYVGVRLNHDPPYDLAIGLAIGGRTTRPPAFERLPVPVLARSACDPLFCTAPCVVKDGVVWRMWYESGLGWPLVDGKPTPRYHMRCAESADGMMWRPTEDVALDLRGDELGFSRATVVKAANGGCEMWFASRAHSHAYRLGYARSDDGRVWRRDDARAGLDAAASGWDSEMITYPWVFDHQGGRYMLYCGNGYGKTGFGLAVWES